MSQHLENFFQAGLQCDHPGCKASIWRVGPSRECAAIVVMTDAKTLGWSVARDRLYEPLEGMAGFFLSRDLCPEHILRVK